MKYTDEEIKKALECCVNNDSCKECPINPNYGNYGYCTSLALTYALNLINRYETEIERLKKELTEIQLSKEMYRFTVEEIKSKAIKEFAERLKAKSYPFPCAIGVEHAVSIRAINDLVKELTEGQ